MEKIYQSFINYLDGEDKDQAVKFALMLLETNQVTVEELYERILTPSLAHYSCPVQDKQICIWKEHVRTSIIRTILESTYAFIIKRKEMIQPLHKKVMVLCPTEEFHEIGAIMITHLFALQGFDAQYVGANTPKEDIVSAMRALQPDYIALSVTNYYNLVVTNRIVQGIRNANPQVKIIVGGQAFLHQGALDAVVHDYYFKGFDDIVCFGRELQV